jgi:hypothetical protein
VKVDTVPLQPLTCTSCGAVVPLGEARFVSCPFCRSETPIPETHRAAQRAARGFAEDRKLAKQLYGRIGKPPGPFARAVSRGILGAAAAGSKASPVMFVVFMAVHPVFGLAIVTAITWALGYPVAMATRAVFRLAGDPVVGPIWPTPILMMTFFLAVFGFGIPFIIVTRERELTEVRAAVHACLAASPPERPGGPPAGRGSCEELASSSPETIDARTVLARLGRNEMPTSRMMSNGRRR